jgi:hypothetical protein
LFAALPTWQKCCGGCLLLREIVNCFLLLTRQHNTTAAQDNARQTHNNEQRLVKENLPIISREKVKCNYRKINFKRKTTHTTQHTTQENTKQHKKTQDNITQEQVAL